MTWIECHCSDFCLALVYGDHQKASSTLVSLGLQCLQVVNSISSHKDCYIHIIFLTCIKPCYFKLHRKHEIQTLCVVYYYNIITILSLQLFEDIAFQREVLSLTVKCSNSAHGCNWTGELRALEVYNN